MPDRPERFVRRKIMAPRCGSRSGTGAEARLGQGPPLRRTSTKPSLFKIDTIRLGYCTISAISTMEGLSANRIRSCRPELEWTDLPCQHGGLRERLGFAVLVRVFFAIEASMQTASM